jgi:hypothetical protein
MAFTALKYKPQLRYRKRNGDLYSNLMKLGGSLGNVPQKMKNVL